jgi:hypothetical protein
MSSFWALEALEDGLQRLAHDLGNGAWERRYGTLVGRDEIDAGYRLVVAAPAGT